MCPKTLRNISDEICNPQSTEFKFNIKSFNELHFPVLSAGVFRFVEEGKWCRRRICTVVSCWRRCLVNECGATVLSAEFSRGPAVSIWRTALASFLPSLQLYSVHVQYYRESPGSFVFPSPRSRVPHLTSRFTYFRCRGWRDRLGAEPCEYASEIKNVTMISFLSKRRLWTENSY